MFPHAFDIEKIRKCHEIGEFDTHYIAAIYGFIDKTDYYIKNQSISFLKNIRVPTIAINARDDPFVEEKALPWEKHLIIDDHLQRLNNELFFEDDLDKLKESFLKKFPNYLTNINNEINNKSNHNSTNSSIKARYAYNDRTLYDDHSIDHNNNKDIHYSAELFDSILSPVRIIYTDKGGHCGFIPENETHAHGWLAEELARSIHHIHSQSY